MTRQPCEKKVENLENFIHLKFCFMHIQGCSLSAGAKFVSCKTHANKNLQEPSWLLQNPLVLLEIYILLLPMCEWLLQINICKSCDGLCKKILKISSAYIYIHLWATLELVVRCFWLFLVMKFLTALICWVTKNAENAN